MCIRDRSGTCARPWPRASPQIVWPRVDDIEVFSSAQLKSWLQSRACRHLFVLLRGQRTRNFGLDGGSPAVLQDQGPSSTERHATECSPVRSVVRTRVTQRGRVIAPIAVCTAAGGRRVLPRARVAASSAKARVALARVWSNPAVWAACRVGE